MSPCRILKIIMAFISSQIFATSALARPPIYVEPKLTLFDRLEPYVALHFEVIVVVFILFLLACGGLLITHKGKRHKRILTLSLVCGIILFSFILAFQLVPEWRCGSVELKENRNECYRDVGQRKGSVSACNKIELQTMGRTYSCLEEAAATKREIEICEFITDPKRRQFCYWSVLKLTKDDSACNNRNSQIDRDACFHYAATETVNVDSCKKIEDSTKIDECHLWIAEKILDLGICNKIQNQDSKTKCYKYIGSESENSSICKQIPDSIEVVRCLRGIAIHKRDIALCEELEIADERDECYFSIATIQDDIALCEKIVGEEEKKKCVAHIEYDGP